MRPCWGAPRKAAAHAKRRVLKPVSAARSRSASPRIPRPRLSDAVGSDSLQRKTEREQEEHRAGRSELQSGQRRIHRPGHGHKPIEPRGEEHHPEFEKNPRIARRRPPPARRESPRMSGSPSMQERHGVKIERSTFIEATRDAARRSPDRSSSSSRRSVATLSPILGDRHGEAAARPMRRSTPGRVGSARSLSGDIMGLLDFGDQRIPQS